MGIEEREVVILAKSRKHNCYCVAGVDCKSKELVRIITDNEENHYAVTDGDISDDKGNTANLFDKLVLVISNKEIDIPHQSENIVLDTKYYVFNEGRDNKLTLKNTINLLSNKYEYIFYNTCNYISIDDFKRVTAKERHSLEIIKCDYLTIRVKKSEKRRLTGSIKYKDIWYNNLTITDCEFEERYFDKVASLPDEKITLRNKYILISLGEEFKGNYYKLIASVLKI